MVQPTLKMSLDPHSLRDVEVLSGSAGERKLLPFKDKAPMHPLFVGLKRRGEELDLLDRSE